MGIIRKFKNLFTEDYSDVEYKSQYGLSDSFTDSQNEIDPEIVDDRREGVFFDYDMLSDYHEDKWDRDDNPDCCDHDDYDYDRSF